MGGIEMRRSEVQQDPANVEERVEQDRLHYFLSCALSAFF